MVSRGKGQRNDDDIFKFCVNLINFNANIPYKQDKHCYIKIIKYLLILMETVKLSYIKFIYLTLFFYI